jgi:hypothetical protein
MVCVGQAVSAMWAIWLALRTGFCQKQPTYLAPAQSHLISQVQLLVQPNPAECHFSHLDLGLCIAVPSGLYRSPVGTIIAVPSGLYRSPIGVVIAIPSGLLSQSHRGCIAVQSAVPSGSVSGSVSGLRYRQPRPPLPRPSPCC